MPTTPAPELVGRAWVGVDAPLTMARLRGRVVVLFFWTSTDVASLRVIEELRRLDHVHAEELVVVGVHTAAFPAEAEHASLVQAVARHRVAHPVLDDPDGRTAAAYGVPTWPALALVDTRGVHVGTMAGEGNGPALGRAVAGLLAAEPRRRRPLAVAPPGAVPEPLAFPAKVAASPDGLRLAIADTGHDRVVVCTLDGLVLHVYTGYLQPHGVRFDGRGVLVCDTVPGRIVRSTGEVLADGIASPWDLVADVDGSWVVAAAGGHRLVRVKAGEISTRVAAGTGAPGLTDGPDLQAELAQPSGVTRTPDGVVFVDAATSALRRLRRDRRSGEVTTLSAGGMQHPRAVAGSPEGGPVYVADTLGSRLLRWDGVRLTPLAVEGLDQPGGLDLLPDGRLVVADTNNHRVVLVDPATGSVDPVELDETWVHAADGPAVSVPPGRTASVAVSIDLVDERLDGAAVVRIEARPARLLDGADGGVRADLVGTSGTVEVRAGAPGAGLLLVEIVANTGSGHRRVQRRRHRLEVGGG